MQIFDRIRYFLTGNIPDSYKRCPSCCRIRRKGGDDPEFRKKSDNADGLDTECKYCRRKEYGKYWEEKGAHINEVRQERRRLAQKGREKRRAL